MKVRKSLAALFDDVASFALGRARLASNVLDDDAWLHPIDADFYLDQPDHYFGPLDREGLPMQVFGDAAPVYVPSRVAAFAFVHWARWRRTGSQTNRAAFLKAAGWFAAFPDGRITHDFELAGMPCSWVSGLAQGEGLSIFARAEILEPGKWSPRFGALFDWLARPIDAGGTLGKLPDGAPFIEEYPGSRHPNVLNGCLYALVGIDDMLRHRAHPGAQQLLDDILDGIEANMSGWERDGWSLYEIYPNSTGAPPNFNTPDYQLVHSALLAYLGRRSGRPVLEAAARRLQRASANPWKRLAALYGKTNYRLRSGW